MTASTLATIQSVNDLLAGTSVSPIAVPLTPHTPTMPETTERPAWMDRKASRKQIARTVRMAELKGKHTFKNTKTGAKTEITEENLSALTAGFVSKLYQTLKAI